MKHFYNGTITEMFHGGFFMFREIEEHGDLTNLGVFDVYPPASDRPAWELVPASYRRTLVKEGERWLGYEYPPV